MKVRFIKEDNLYKLQIKNFIGIWKTQREKICSDGIWFKQDYAHKDKEALLRYIVYGDYWTKRDATIIEYPTIKKYKLY